MCSGTLTLEVPQDGSVRSDHVLLREDVTVDPNDACTRQQWAVLTLAPSGQVKYDEADHADAGAGQDGSSKAVGLLTRTGGDDASAQAS